MNRRIFCSSTVFGLLLLLWPYLPAVRADEPIYSGKPLSYWIGQAKTATAAEEVDKTVAALAEALASDQISARVAAADALESLGPKARKAAPALASQFEHPHGWLRIACADALIAIGPDSVPWVVEAMRKGSPPAQVRAAAVLGTLGPAARAAIPDLKKIIQTAPPEVVAQLSDYLAMIERPSDSATLFRQAAPGNIPSPSSAAIPDVPAVAGADWPQFHGPARDNLCRETGLLEQWPKEGLKLLWKIQGLGKGFSTVSIAGGRLYTMGDLKRGGEDESQYVLAYDLAGREPLWATRIGPPHTDGPRSTPTVDGQRLYALGTEGDLVCLETAGGKIVWQRNLAKDFGGRMMSGWKYSESPLVDGDRLIVTPGGDEAMLAALNKTTGETIWKAAVPKLGDRGKDGAAYASAVAATIAGLPQYVQVIGRGVVGIDAASGRFLWGYNRLANTTASITSALVRGNCVFATNSYRSGSALLRIARDGDAFKVEEVYYLTSKEFENHHGGVVLVGDYLYGGSGQNRGELVCLELATGKVAWRNQPLARGSAAVLYADGHVLVRYDRGEMAWLRATPEGLRIDGKFLPATGDGPAWPHPVIHDGRLYLRHGDVLACYDLRRGEAGSGPSPE